MFWSVSWLWDRLGKDSKGKFEFEVSSVFIVSIVGEFFVWFLFFGEFNILGVVPLD